MGDAFVALGTRDELDKGLNSARSKVNGWLSNISQGIAQGIGQAVAQGVGNLIRSGLDQIGKATKSASDLNETIAKTNAVFRDSSGDILAWSTTTSRAFGLTQQGALSAASSLGNMFKQLGAGTDDAATFSKSLVGLAGDLVAFHNVAGGTEEVLNDIQSAFRGEYDPIQKYIPILNAAVVEQRALAETGKESAKSLTALDKAMAVQSLIVSGMGDAYGAAAREIESAASQQRIFDARIEESRAQLGQVGVIVQQVFYKSLNELLDSMGFYGQNIVEQLVVGLTRGLTAITPFLAQLRGVFVRVLQPGSPPKLLPELTAWGKAAMQEYLRGWTLADFDALEQVGGMMERVIRSFASSGNIAETDLVSRVFGSQRSITQAIREFRELGQVSEATLGGIADAAGPAGTEVAELVRRYFDLQRASKGVVDAQNELNEVTDKYTRALNPVNAQLDAVRRKQREISDNQELEDLGKIIADPRADADDRQMARLKAEEIQLERQADAIEGEQKTAVDAAQAKIDAAQKEESAQKQKYDIAQQALDQQTKTNALIAEETDLRVRLINEGLAEEKRVLAELEAEQRKAAAEAGRIADAQLRYRLELADTAGDLEIMRGELAKTSEGSAEYFDILSQIHSLEERLADEREGTGGGAQTFIEGAGKAAQDNKPYLDDFRLALEGATGALFGTDGQEAKLTPFWSGVADTIDTITEAAGLAIPVIQSLVDYFFSGGGDSFANQMYLPSVGGGTGGAGANIMGRIYNAVTGVIDNLKALLTGDWATLWDNFKAGITNFLKGIDPDANPTSFAFYAWIKDELIPAIEELATGEWARVWKLFAELAMAPFIALDEFLKARGFGNEGPVGIAPDPSAPDFKTPGSDGGNTFQGLLDNFNAYLEALRARMRELLPDASGLPFPSHEGPGEGIWDFAPQSFVTPQAGASSTSTVGDTITFFIEQNIAANSDFGGARQGAEAGMASIRETLLQRRLQGA